MTETKRKKIPMELFTVIQETVRRLKYFPVNSRGAKLAASLAVGIVTDIYTFRALQRLTLEEREKSKRLAFGTLVPTVPDGSLIEQTDQTSDLAIPRRPAHVRDMSWAHKYYIRCLELAGLVVKARGELKAARQEIDRLREHLRLKDLATKEFQEAWTDREHNSAATVRQLKGTIHLLTQGS